MPLIDYISVQDYPISITMQFVPEVMNKPIYTLAILVNFDEYANRRTLLLETFDFFFLHKGKSEIVKDRQFSDLISKKRPIIYYPYKIP